MRIGNYSSRAIVTGILMMGTLAAQAQQENMETIVDLHHIMAYLVATFLISVFVMIFYNRLIYFREKDVTKEAERLIAQLSLVMDANKTQAWAYDLEKDFYTVFSALNCSLVMSRCVPRRTVGFPRQSWRRIETLTS